MIIEDELDEIVQINGPLLVSAGPGMGKTYALAYKLKHLVECEEIAPEEITVIAFTNEAAINMRRRISNKRDKKTYIEMRLQPSKICTMHKLGHSIIRDNFLKLNLQRDINVLSFGYLKEILTMDSAQIIGAKRKEAKETIICRQKGKCEKTDDVKCEICDKYKELLRKYNYIDHDDQIMLACELLKKDKDVLAREQQRANHLLVDEYQDINYAQWELIRLLSAGNERNLFVVGDQYQSIYKFRGGSPEYIRNFASDYAPNATIKQLAKSYRCPPKIFKGAFHMVQRYTGGDLDFVNKIEYIEQGNGSIIIYNFAHSNLEANFIAREVREIGPSYDTLILIPTIAYAKPIRRELRKKFVEFSCDYEIEKTEFYIIYILLEWLKNTSNNFNLRILIDKLINKKVPSGERENILKQISNFWLKISKGKTLYQLLKSRKDELNFEKLVNTVVDLRSSWGNEDKVSNFLSKALEELDVWKNSKKFADELISITKEICGIKTSGGGPSVRVLTMKKAKGLEADYVFIVGLENNILPRKDAKKEDKEEDSRLLYVSMTRAKKELYLLYSNVRDRSISKVMTKGKSKFIDAIPNEFIKRL